MLIASLVFLIDIPPKLTRAPKLLLILFTVLYNVKVPPIFKFLRILPPPSIIKLPDVKLKPTASVVLCTFNVP
jgi:hypothetical protein